MIGYSSFPDEFVDPEEKQTPDYGLRYAKAAFHAFTRFGTPIFYNDQDNYRFLRDLAQGRQSLEPLSKLMGYVDETNRDESFAYLDLQVLNYAHSLINYVQGRLRRMDHELTLTAIDPVAQEHRRRYEATGKAYLQLKEWAEQIQIPAQELFSDIDLATIPDEPDEFLIDMDMNWQHKAAMKAEIRLKKLLEKAVNYPQIKKQQAFDLPVYGVTVTRCYLDKNGIPRAERIHPANFLCSHAKTEDFHDLEYGGHVEYISSSQFRREASPFLTPSQIKEVIDGYGSKDYQHIYGHYTQEDLNHRFDNVTYVPVFRFQFLTENQETYDIRYNQFGNKVVISKRFDYEPSESTKGLYVNYGGNERELIRPSYTCKYGGTWVVGSDVVYDYGKMPRLLGDLVNDRLDYIVCAPNMQDGRIVSLLAQMKEPLEMLNLAHNKIKEILANGFMGLLEVDVRKLEQMPIGKGGKNLKPREVIDLMFKKKILYYRSNINQYEQSDGKAISESPLGLTLADYFNAKVDAENTLRAMTGISAQAEGMMQNGDLVGNTKNSVAQTEIKLDYLVYGMQTMFQGICESTLILSQVSEENSLAKGTSEQNTLRDIIGYDEVLDGEISFHQYAIVLTPKPTLEEWTRFYASVDRALAAGTINMADAIYLYRIDNLKQAEQVLIARQRKRERDAAKQAQAQMEQNQQSQMESNEQAFQNQARLMQLEFELQAQLEEIKAMRNRQLKADDFAYKRDLTSRTGAQKLQNTKLLGSNDFIKQAMKNKVEAQKVDKRPDRSPQD